MDEYCFSDETDDIVCEICGGRSDVGIRRVMFDGFSCRHCLNAWHEGAGLTTEAVRAASLRDQEILKRAPSAGEGQT
jgi:ribosomal protein L37AE/L43A